jgi:hypothetical protein
MEARIYIWIDMERSIASLNINGTRLDQVHPVTHVMLTFWCDPNLSITLSIILSMFLSIYLFIYIYRHIDATRRGS